MAHAIHHRPDQQRFETEVDGALCVLCYRLADGTASMDSVQVPDAVGGRGIAGALTRFALDHARQAGWKVIPRCPYVRGWIERHPAYRDLVAD